MWYVVYRPVWMRYSSSGDRTCALRSAGLLSNGTKKPGESAAPGRGRGGGDEKV